MNMSLTSNKDIGLNYRRGSGALLLLSNRNSFGVSKLNRAKNNKQSVAVHSTTLNVVGVGTNDDANLPLQFKIS